MYLSEVCGFGRVFPSGAVAGNVKMSPLEFDA